jgi:hypothetical protein
VSVLRLVIVIISLIALFALLARALPPAYYLPLYCLFLLGGIGFAFWERRRLQLRQARLEEEYRAQQVDWQAITWEGAEEE